jgi:putative FmdB family regulatory protein
VPTYEYTCSECGADQDIVQAMSDPTLTVCPLCNAEALRKRFTNVGVVFKGSGFYRNDARTKDSKPATDTKKAAPDKSSGSATTPSTTTPSTSSSTTSSST